LALVWLYLTLTSPDLHVIITTAVSTHPYLCAILLVSDYLHPKPAQREALRLPEAEAIAAADRASLSTFSRSLFFCRCGEIIKHTVLCGTGYWSRFDWVAHAGREAFDAPPATERALDNILMIDNHEQFTEGSPHFQSWGYSHRGPQESSSRAHRAEHTRRLQRMSPSNLRHIASSRGS
jgi:hypothetical protein